MSSGWGLREWMSLGIYEILTIVLWGICGYRADRYGWKNANIIGRVCIIIWTISMSLSVSLAWIIWFGALVALGNNLIFWAWAHILEETNTDHTLRSDWLLLHESSLVSVSRWSLERYVVISINHYENLSMQRWQFLLIVHNTTLLYLKLRLYFCILTIHH
jgi:hypothetical protein